MKLPLSLCSLVAAASAIGLAAEAPAQARAAEFAPRGGQELPPYLQCVPYAREVSGVSIYGDAHTWWEQAAGRYERGNVPRVGAVMAFRPTGKMRLGHVAAVSKIIDSRTVLLDHANWSPINGRRGQIERNVRAVDVSRDNDWSKVRVWYHPLQGLGKTAWPVHGFIYSKAVINREPFERDIAPQPPVRVAIAKKPSRGFMSAFADVGRHKAKQPAHTAAHVHRPQRAAKPIAERSTAVQQPADPFAAIVSKYDPAR
ncbi:CHAP domain-containing protein [Erythrobacter litoralis]|uniref:Peptidase C51 domain-containing protein n=1 Tax=Erythrobacter litoralis (strain HTCC2594) TaxID=314225 RepID=Q2NDD1_ERYLH|nr:CHAP domain-containing protein [Erythrobacter litoralis]ABC62310.1 hypothetical protein ELI_01090 [Erythrobacter litoralis HTCC2594]